MKFRLSFHRILFLAAVFVVLILSSQVKLSAKNDLKVYQLQYDKPAPDSNIGWEDLSLPLGNGHFGVNLFLTVP